MAESAGEAGGLLDPLEDAPDVREYFGDRHPILVRYARLLTGLGVERGLLGPREAGRIWERHLLNCAAVVPFLGSGAVADVGSGAGLPGLVVAIVQPERDIILIEPMARRAAWLDEVATILALDKVTVIRARAEDIEDEVRVQTVLARAVAPLSKLVLLCGGLVEDGGEMLFLKGRNAEEEIRGASDVLHRKGLRAEAFDAKILPRVRGTTIVRIRPREVGREAHERLES